jgi:hypothetical protein
VRLTPLLIAAALLLGGSSAAASRSISPAEYARRADAICTDYRARVQRLPRVAPSDFPSVVKLAIAVHAIVAMEDNRIHAIPLPGRARERASKWVAGHDRTLVLLDNLRIAAKKRSARLVQQANVALNANGSRDKALSRMLGMKVCSKV